MLIRPGGIGDCILSFPALEFLRAEYTEVWISSPLVPLVRFADHVRSISSIQLDLVIADNFPESLKAKLEGFDDIVSWYGTNRPDFREAMHGANDHCWFLDALPGEKWNGHATDFFLKQVGAPLGTPARIEIDPASPRYTLAIHPFSGSKRKNWPLERFRILASKLMVPAEWTAGPEEALEGAHRFESLLELGRWLNGACIYLGNDSGVSHLAAATGLPAIVLFGPTDPDVWAPRGNAIKVIRHQPLDELPIDSVLEAIDRLVSRQPS